MKRIVAGELLDVLPPFAPAALQSRRDLRRLNSWMGNARCVERSLRALFPNQPPARLAEIGAGDGSLSLKLARALQPRWPHVELTLIDRQPVIRPEAVAGINALRWKAEVITADVFDMLESSTPFDAVVANLFLHHFTEKDLQRLLHLISRKTRVFVACEPNRSIAGLCAQPLLWLIGCNSVTRNDAPISVRAGFRNAELASLWPAPGWKLSDRVAGFFCRVFAAWQNGA